MTPTRLEYTIIQFVNERSRMQLFQPNLLNGLVFIGWGSFPVLKFFFKLLFKNQEKLGNSRKEIGAEILRKSRISRTVEMFCKKKIVRNFAKFTGKHLCLSLFLITLQASGVIGRRDKGGWGLASVLDVQSLFPLFKKIGFTP